MDTPKVLDARVVGTRYDVPQHPRVEPPTVKTVLQKRPSRLHSVSADASSLEALKIMAEHDLDAVLVSEGGHSIGIFSHRDYARSSIRATHSPTDIPVRDAMTSCDVFADLTDSLQTCLGLMLENRLRYLPVQDNENPVALLSLEDILAEMVAYLERVFKEYALDNQIAFLRGTYSC
jgi:CBS domain-containing protein